MRSKGFTIIEILVVITIIAVLSGLAIITYNNIRADSRDAERKSNATVVSEGLEKYYEKNGEYPSVASLMNSDSGNTADAIASKLSIPVDSLVMPNMPGSTQNGIASGTSPYDDYLMYEASSETNDAACQSDINGGCDKYTLRYSEEGSGETIAIESRRSTRPTTDIPELSVASNGMTSINTSWSQVTNATTYALQRSINPTMSSPETSSHTDPSAAVTGLTPNTQYYFRVRAFLPSGTSEWSDVETATTDNVTAPTGTITINATMAGTDARGTASGGACAGGATISYQIRYRINSGSFTAWTDGSPRDVAATEGYTYTFQSQARCSLGGANSSWVQSSNSAITRPVTAPAGLTIVAAMNGTNARGTAGGGSCASGTTIERQIRYSGTSYSDNWQAYTAGSPRDVAANQGWRYTFQQQARCVGTNANSSWATSGTDAVVRPITFTPSAPSVSTSTNGSTTTWSWNATSGCPTGTAATYQYRTLQDGGVATTSWYGPYDSYTSNTLNTSLQGYQYTREIQTRCFTVFTDGPWSNSGSSSYLRTITTPGTLSNVRLQSMAQNRSQATLTWDKPTCGAGTVPYGNTTLYMYGGWNPAYSGYGTHSTYVITAQPPPLPNNFTVGVRGRYKCVNINTSRESAEGSMSPSTTFNI